MDNVTESRRVLFGHLKLLYKKWTFKLQKTAAYENNQMSEKLQEKNNFKAAWKPHKTAEKKEKSQLTQPVPVMKRYM